MATQRTKHRLFVKKLRKDSLKRPIETAHKKDEKKESLQETLDREFNRLFGDGNGE